MVERMRADAVRGHQTSVKRDNGGLCACYHTTGRINQGYMGVSAGRWKTLWQGVRRLYRNVIEILNQYVVLLSEQVLRSITPSFTSYISILIFLTYMFALSNLILRKKAETFKIHSFFLH